MTLENNYKKFMNTYGNVTVEFSDYYNYHFTYWGYTDSCETLIIVHCGGKPETMRRLEVAAGCKYKVKDLPAFRGKAVNKKDGAVISEFYFTGD